MQSESQAHSTTAVTENSPHSPGPTSQHGVHHRDGQIPGSSPSADDAASKTSVSAEQQALDSAIAASLQDTVASTPAKDRRLNRHNTPSPPAYNRIVEYEQAAVPSARKKDEGPVFEVVKKTRSPNDKRSPIQDLPNGESSRSRRPRALLTYSNRDLDALAGSSDSYRPGIRVSRLQALPRLGDRPTCVAHGVCTLLSRP
jgi:hypothetical protein